ncbi:tryptophan-rich sensory protein [Helcococcus bovis]|uniref:tryptophan-rich sensory protein n=1 Tax=Helcococcus bovis TaxID=3153252 RepID=UPI0038BD3F32
MKSISTKVKSWINLIVFAITLIINYLTASGFINGMSQKVVSNKYNTLITPAGFAFSIWGLIYLLIGISLVYMLLNNKETRVKSLINILTPIFLFNCLFNILWNISFLYEK